MDKFCKYCECYIDVDDDDAVVEDAYGNIFCCESHYDLYWFGESEEEPLDWEDEE